MGDDPQHILFKQSQMRPKSLKDPHITRVLGTPGTHIPNDMPPPHPHITRDMGIEVPKLGGPNFMQTPHRTTNENSIYPVDMKFDISLTFLHQSCRG